MRRIWLVAAVIVLLPISPLAQVQAPPAPWRGAGPTPCTGTDGGVYKCVPPPGPIAVKAGRLFDSKSGQMLTRQVVLISGERVTEVGPEGQVKIPAGVPVIDLSRATVLPGLIDAHTHLMLWTLTMAQVFDRGPQLHPDSRSGRRARHVDGRLHVGT